MANEIGEDPKPSIENQATGNKPGLSEDERLRRLESENIEQPLEALIREQNQPQTQNPKPENPQEVLRRLRAERRASKPLIVRNPRNKPRP